MRGAGCLQILLALLCWVAWIGPVKAQNIESVLSPGKLAQAHAKWEEDCQQCHVRFDRSAQDRLCMDCHKDIGQDMRARSGYHGRLKPQPCRACHTDHKGANAAIVSLDKTRFDHASTDFALRGSHAKVACETCHPPGKKFRQAPSACNACHQKDDVHKGSLGAACADCHNEGKWKETRFDHAKTRFALTGKHAEAKCADCHKDGKYNETPRACVACHRKVDDQKGHKGQFGERCETCHGTTAWKPSPFNHDTDAHYALRGKHRTAKCTDCHAGPLYKSKTPQACVDCHGKDDVHKKTLGRECGACHTEREWKEKARFDHDKTRFPLLGKHAGTDCKACHKSALYKEAPSECIGCHKKDDRHEATLGVKCGDCHIERDWKTTAGRFDHDRTKFRLRNAHARSTVKCDACHKDLRSFRNTAADCYSCHRKDDRHEGQEGGQCEQCHSDASWKVAAFDHSRTRFVLTGRHLVVGCKDCHATARYRDAKSECGACHAKDDKHALKFGVQCASCHNARAWAIWTFDHNRRSSYPLDGAHVKVACERCHTRGAPAGKAIAPLGNTCVSCHRGDDPHDGNFGTRCEQCHATGTWKQVSRRTGAVESLDEPLGRSSLFRRMAAGQPSSGLQ